MKLVYSERAVSDLARLRDFISKHNPSAATRIAAELVAKVEHLRRFPLIGRLVEESPEPQQIRDLVVSDYLVRYLPTENAIIGSADGQRGDPGIRSNVGSPNTQVVDKGLVTRDIIFAPEGDGRDASAAIPGA